jgi:hypothetical protein
MTDQDVSVRIVRRAGDGKPFTEIFYAWEGGLALSRVPWKMDDTPHQRTYEAQQFRVRRGE